MQWEEDEKPTPAQQEAMLKQWEENWNKAPITRNQAEETEAQWEACTVRIFRSYLLHV